MTNLLESIVTSDKCVVPSQLVRPSLGVIKHLVDPLVVQSAVVRKTCVRSQSVLQQRGNPQKRTVGLSVHDNGGSSGSMRVGRSSEDIADCFLSDTGEGSRRSGEGAGSGQKRREREELHDAAVCDNRQTKWYQRGALPCDPILRRSYSRPTHDTQVWEP